VVVVLRGAIAQLGERLVRNEEVSGSIPLSSTKESNLLGRLPENCLMALEKELAAYRSKLSELKGSEGKFVLIHGDELVDTFGSYEDAIKEGYSRFKLEPFLVKQIHSIEQIQFISRFVDPCAAGRQQT